jgi:predicted enzyme related to lactoylglutathione lyase
VATDLLVNIDVADLEKAVAFYRDGLGLTPGRRPFDGAVEMLGASSPIYLLEKPAGSTPFAHSKQRRDYRRHWTPVHLDVVVADVHAAVDKAKAAGARLEDKVQTFRWGHIATLADPFGNGFCLIQFLGRGYDESAG